MTDLPAFFVPDAMTIALPVSGRTARLHRGIQSIPSELADHEAANSHGIKPVEEMTDAEWRSIGRKRPVVAKVDVPAIPAAKIDPAAPKAV